MDGLLGRALRRQRRAQRILEELDLLARWRTLGRPVVVGSVRTGLVVARDIDLVVHVDEPDVAKGFELIQQIAVLEGVYVVYFENKLRTPFAALYWEIGYGEGEDGWSIEHSVLGPDCPHAHYPEETTQALLEALDDDKRRCILAIKEEKLRRYRVRYEGDRGEAGIDLYRAVFDGGATTYDECVAWLQKHRREGNYRWVPGMTAL
jgi:hypothetical protein